MSLRLLQRSLMMHLVTSASRMLFRWSKCFYCFNFLLVIDYKTFLPYHFTPFGVRSSTPHALICDDAALRKSVSYGGLKLAFPNESPTLQPSRGEVQQLLFLWESWHPLCREASGESGGDEEDRAGRPPAAPGGFCGAHI